MIKTWWESLSEREHKQVIAAAVVLLVGLFYISVWLPLGNAVINNQSELDRQLTLNAWGQDAIQQIKAAGGKSANPQSLSQIVNQTSRQFNVKIDRMNPKDEQLQLLIDEIVFNDLLNWLAHLEQAQGVSIQSLDISESEVPGIVKVPRLVIEKH